jgi:flagellar hook protein FlgE
VGTDGQVYGVDTTTGQEEPITDAIVGLTVFSNQNGLIREGSNLYSEGADSGTATTNGDAGADPALFGNVLDNSLEGSNVDLSKEMVDMIIYQAGFNANSKTITTSSSLLDTTIAMVR